MRTELSSLEQKLRREPGLSGRALPHLVPPCDHAHPARLLCFSVSSVCLTLHLGGNGPGREGTGSPMSVHKDELLCPHTQ